MITRLVGFLWPTKVGADILGQNWICREDRLPKSKMTPIETNHIFFFFSRYVDTFANELVSN
jgi:hypothetical protein